MQRVDEYPTPKDWDTFVAILSKYDADGVGIAIAAPIENHTRVIKAPNLPWLDGRDVRKELQSALGKDVVVVVSNDVEAAAEGEMARGTLRSYRWAIFDNIGTGWGGCLILNGQRVDGEPGHVNISFDQREVCGCGGKCNEALFSGSGMERRILDYLRARNMVFPSDLKAWDYFYKELETEATWAVALLDEWAEGVGRAWANVLNRIRPLEAIVYMGTTAEELIAIPRVKKKIHATIRRICMFPEHKRDDFPIEQATEPNRSIYGAVIVYDAVREPSHT